MISESAQLFWEIGPRNSIWPQRLLVQKYSERITGNKLAMPKFILADLLSTYIWLLMSPKVKLILNNWRCRSITILCRILVCFFFSSKWAEFLHVVSDLIESHSPVFFSAGLRFVFQLKRMQKTWRRFLQSVVERAKQKKPIVFPNNETSEASCSRLFFCICFYSKMKRKPAEKNTGLWLSIKSETTCKNSAHLDEKKKNRPKFDIEWLCSEVFNCISKLAKF